VVAGVHQLGSGRGEDVIYDRNCHQIAVVNAADGLGGRPIARAGAQ
jgi:hypothetical protein